MNRFTRFIRNTLLLLVAATQTRAATVTANFNGAPIPAGRKIWYSAVVNFTGTTSYPLTLYFTNQTISSPLFSRTVPDAILVIDPAVSTATTVFNGTTWVTTAPPGLSGYYFISGFADSLTSSLPGNVSPVSWTGTFKASRPGVSFVWHMQAAVYTSFNSNLNNLGVKTSNCHSCTIYPNSDGAGTPENYKAYVVGGARGGGGSNYTGGYSGAGHESPSAITYYSTELCTGSSTTITPLSVSGGWASSNPAVATVTSAGVVTGVSAGTAKISYNISGSSVPQVINATVNAAPALTASATPASACVGATLALSATASGGSSGGSCGPGGGHGGGSGSGSSGYTFAWTGPGSYTSALQNPNRSGITTAMAGAYSVTVTDGNGCRSSASTLVSVSTAPSAGTISGSSTVAVGGTTSMANPNPGGTWSSGKPSVATINSSGVVTGISTGSATISYRITNSCGTAYATRPVTVSAAPSAGTISGGSTVCTGATLALSNSATGGVWTSNNTGVASVSATGLVTGIAPGTATISYTVSSGGATASATRVVSVNLSANAGTIAGSSSVCAGSSLTLTNTATGGAWSSATPGVATVSAAGLVTGVAAGTALISYTVTTACGTAFATRAVSVNALPVAGSIAGASSVCTGAAVTLSNAVGGGSWSSGSAAIATVGATGVVTGVGSGTTNISYTVTNGCGSASAVAAMSVNLSPNAGTITGGSSVCPGSAITMTNAATGGVWSSGNTAIAMVGATGTVAGVAQGTAVISYVVANGCGTATATRIVSVSALPDAGTISGTTNVCTGTTTVLSNAVSGGVWSSGNTAVATVNATGVVTGLAAGSAIISYVVTNGCGSASATTVVTVGASSNAGAITGGSSVCAGSDLTLSSSVSGGVWASSNTAIATVSASGVVTGIATGSATISYGVTGSCGAASATKLISVNSLPSVGVVTGSTSVCAGAAITLGNAVAGGSWIAADGSIASVNATGVVTGIAAGTTDISYTVTNGCGTASAHSTIAVIGLPVAGAITGGASVCAGSTTALANATSGGSWSSATPGVATVGSTGVVTGLSAGTATISYTVTNGCGSTAVSAAVVVNALPDAGAITGSSSVCQGLTLSLSGSVGGGVWSSSNTSVATVSSTGLVTAIAAGSSTIAYTVTNSCGSANTTKVITVNPAADAGTISGGSVVCTGSLLSLGACTGGGTWSSGTLGVATVSATGEVTALAAGTTIISYTVTNSCGTATATKVVSVNAVPAGLSGPSSVGIGSNILLTTSGGSWSSSNPLVATVDGSGNITGVNVGTVTISYTVSNSCYSYATTKVVTVNAAVIAPITGALTMCVGSTSALSSATPGGSWSSDNTAVATVSLSGLVSGVSAGTATISYGLLGGVATEVITVNAMPSAIVGGNSVCAGSSLSLSNSVTGGTWASSTPAVATVDSATGVVTGVSDGSATVVYTLLSGCSTSIVVNVTSVNSITGASIVCSGDVAMLANATMGGSWSSSAPSVASVNALGMVSGLSAGMAEISYTAFGCVATQVVSVFATPGAISGPVEICEGASASYTNATSGGAWSSASTNIAIDGSGSMTGIAAGTATITYANAGGCNATMTISVNTTPVAISGPTTLCIGGTVSLSDATAGAASWSGSNSAVATIAGTGLVTGLSAGTAVITYALSSGCSTTTTVTVMSGLSAISDNAPVCAGSTLSLSHSTPGGTWSSSNAAIATVESSGVVSGVAGGTAVITYTTGGGCSASVVVTVNTLLPISGSGSTCVGNVTTLTDGTSGGTWTSSDASIATVGSTSGIVTGVGNGIATITYTLSNGCSRTTTVDISTMTPITGAATLCVGLTVSLSNATPGGVWTSSWPPVAAVGAATGIVTGNSVGTATITYTAGTCKTTAVVSVGASPTAISGQPNICLGSSVALTNATPGGAWSTSGTNIAISGTASTTLTVTGLALGTATISYHGGSAGCYRVFNVSVNPLPAPIEGTYTVCPGGTASLTDASSGGAWSSSDNAKALVNVFGVVTGQTSGAVTISYKFATGCAATTIMTVIASPSAIVGPTTVCSGATITLSDTTGAGAWTSSAPAIATAGSATGIVTGITPGTTNISFTLAATGCRVKSVVTVTPIPNAGVLSGPTSVAAGATTTITSSGNSGGVWSSSDASVATVGSSGALSAVVSGVSGGSVFITYAVSTACGFSGAYKPLTVTEAAMRSMTGGATMPGIVEGSTAQMQSLTQPETESFVTEESVTAPARRQVSTLTVTDAMMVNAQPIDVRVIPNPNGGSFAIKGTSGTLNDGLVDVEVANMLGQVIYKSKLMTQKGVINEQVQLGNNLSNGTYMLTIRNSFESRTFHFVMRH